MQKEMMLVGTPTTRRRLAAAVTAIVLSLPICPASVDAPMPPPVIVVERPYEYERVVGQGATAETIEG